MKLLVILSHHQRRRAKCWRVNTSNKYWRRTLRVPMVWWCSISGWSFASLGCWLLNNILLRNYHRLIELALPTSWANDCCLLE